MDRSNPRRLIDINKRLHPHLTFKRKKDSFFPMLLRQPAPLKIILNYSFYLIAFMTNEHEYKCRPIHAELLGKEPKTSYFLINIKIPNEIIHNRKPTKSGQCCP